MLISCFIEAQLFKKNILEEHIILTLCLLRKKNLYIYISLKKFTLEVNIRVSIKFVLKKKTQLMHPGNYKYSQTRPLQLSSLLCIWHKHNRNIPEDRLLRTFRCFELMFMVLKEFLLKKNTFNKFQNLHLGNMKGKFSHDRTHFL